MLLLLLYESVLDFLRESALWLQERMKHTWVSSALRDVHIILDTNKTHPKRRYYIFAFNLNLYLLTLALENLYFNTLDLEKSAGEEFRLY